MRHPYQLFTASLDLLSKPFTRREPPQPSRPSSVVELDTSIYPMPPSEQEGWCRDPAFAIPQFHTSIQGLKTAFFDGGEGEPVVFIHGLAANLTHSIHIAPHFARRFRVIGLDLPGTGESDKSNLDYSVDMYVDHLERLLDRLDLDRVVLVGHSLGGMVSTAFTMAHPERVKAVVLVNPAGLQPVPLPLRLGGHILMRPWFLDRVLPVTWKSLLSAVFYEKNRFTRQFIDACEETANDGHIGYVSHMISALRADFLDRDFGPMLHDIEVPTWLIWGAHDLLVPASRIRRAAELFSNVEIEEIPKCGHMPNIEYPFRLISFIERAIRTAEP